jgi:hypothetical protein
VLKGSLQPGLRGALIIPFSFPKFPHLVSQILSSKTPQPALASYGKLAGGTLMAIRARIGVEIGGPEVLLWEHGADAGATEHAVKYLNGRITSIAGGTNEMVRNGISERVRGLPREPRFDSNKPFSEVVPTRATGTAAFADRGPRPVPIGGVDNLRFESEK